MNLANRPGTLLALACLALLCAGCGGTKSSTDAAVVGDTSTTSAEQRPTRAEFIADADQVCKKTRRTVRRLRADLQRLPEVDESYGPVSRILGRVADEIASEREGLARLSRPEGDDAQIGGLLESMNEYAVVNRRLSQAFSSRDEGTISTLTDEIGSIESRLTGLADGYGLKVCWNDDPDAAD